MATSRCVEYMYTIIRRICLIRNTSKTHSYTFPIIKHNMEINTKLLTYFIHICKPFTQGDKSVISSAYQHIMKWRPCHNSNNQSDMYLI